MARLVSKASLINLAGAAAIALTCAGWSAAETRQEPQARDGARRPIWQKNRDGAAVQAPGDPQPLEKQGRPRSAAAAPEVAACSSGTATACRAIESGMTRGEWAWTDGGVTAMDDWETQAARADASKMTLKFKPEPTRKLEARPVTPTSETIQRVLTACDNGDVSACAAFAASIGPRVYNIPAAPAS